MNIAMAAEALNNGSITSAALVEQVISNVAARDGVVKAFLKLDVEKVRKLAAESDARRAAGKALSEYDGIPIGIKDCIVTEGETCACASKILENVDTMSN